MSKCWYCNEELTTANYCDEHIGICTKCYGSMFKVSNEFVKGLIDKIADLETKLAESEKEIEDYQKLITDICNKYRVASLKELDEMYQATTESLYASREYLEELKSEKWELEEQLKKEMK